MGSRSIAQNSRALYRRIRRNRLKSQGRCVACSTIIPKGSNLVKCPACTDIQAKARKQYREKRIAKGLCLYCDAPKPANRQYCDECREIKVLYRSAIRQDRREKGLCLDCGKIDQQEHLLRCAKCLNTRKADIRRERDLIKDEVFDAYGGYICNCCGETEPLFLEIDHVHNNGYEMRKVHGTGSHMYSWLKANNYPNDFQILCSNCNRGKYRNGGACPHLAA